MHLTKNLLLHYNCFVLQTYNTSDQEHTYYNPEILFYSASILYLWPRTQLHDLERRTMNAWIWLLPTNVSWAPRSFVASGGACVVLFVIDVVCVPTIKRHVIICVLRIGGSVYECDTTRGMVDVLECIVSLSLSPFFSLSLSLSLCLSLSLSLSLLRSCAPPCRHSLRTTRLPEGG